MHEMSTHEVKVIFNGSAFNKCYFTLDEEKSIRLRRGRDGIFKGFWKSVDLRDTTGRESVRFSLVARGVPQGGCHLKILVDNNKLITYGKKDEFRYERDGWLSKVDVIFLPEH